MEETKRDIREENEKKEAEAKAHVEMWKYIFGFTNMAVVKCAIQLKIAETIENHNGPITLYDLSSTLNCSPSSLYRVMRFLVHHNIFREHPIGCSATTGYIHTPLSRLLLGRGEKGMADFILLESSSVMLEPWLHLSTNVKAGGRSAFVEANGEEVWRYAAANSGHGKLIDDAMACDTTMTVNAMIEGCPEVFDGIETLVDVGGGNGTALRLLVKAFGWIHGMNFDLPHVVSVAPACDGVKHVGGDMFKSVPQADAVIIKWVLHDWNDEECIQILKNCKEAIPKGKGKVIIVEAVVDEMRDDKLKFVRLMLDMVMMAHTNSGKERTSKEWEYVIREAGYSHHTIKPIRAVQSVIEAFP